MAYPKSRHIYGLLVVVMVLAGATAVDEEEEEIFTWEDDDDTTTTPVKNQTDAEVSVDPCANFTNSRFDETTGKCICDEAFACLHFEKIQNGRIFATPCALGQVTRRREKGKQIFIKHDLVPVNCSSCFCKATSEKNRQVRGRMIFATVPRSGNSWMRRMLERASHLPTETVYRGERVKKRPRNEAQYVALDGRAPFSVDTGLFEQPCGMDNNCDQVYVRNCTASTVIAKTHSPFLQQMHARYHKHAGSDVGIGASALVSVRNPLDNFDAWYRYTGAKGNFSSAEGGRDVNFKAFLEDWTEHNQYWLTNAIQHQVPSIFYRYEDLTIDKCRFNIIKSALQESGLWAELLLSDYDVALSSKDMQPNQGVESKLSEAQGKSGHSYPKADIELALQSPLVKLFGYEKLYKSWLNPDEDDGETEHDWENGENCVYRLPSETI
eukprot:m.263184 g.263184  ORF g.263184 m.263184 type:complete len:438 (+) comp49241_c0_seq1:399-1712(+)